MASKLELLAEAHRRGILPPDKVPLFEEAQRRGLIDGGQKSPSGTDRSGWSQSMRKGYEDFNSNLDPRVAQDGSALLLSNSATFGFGDEISAGIKAGAGALYDISQGQEPRFSERYDEAWGGEQARLDSARKNAWLGGVPADIAGGLTMGPVKAGVQAAVAPLSLRQAASQSAKSGAAYGAAYGAGADDSGTLSGRAEAASYGGLGGYLFGRAVPNVIAGGSLAKRKLIDEPARAAKQRLSDQANRAAQDFADAGINPDEVFGPALVQGGPVDGVSSHLSGTIFGGALRDGSNRTVQALEKKLAEEVAAAGGRQTAVEAGTEVQGLLRKNLTERTIPSDAIKAMTPEQLQDISGVAPGPKYDPPPPSIDPIPPRPVKPQTAEDVLRAAEMEVPDQLPLYPPTRQPKYPDEATPKYVNPTFDEIGVPPQLNSQRQSLISTYKEVGSRHDQLVKTESKMLKEIDSIHKTAGVDGSRLVGGQLRVTVGGTEYRWNGRTLLPPRSAPRPDLAIPYQDKAEPQSRGLLGMLMGSKPKAVPEPPPIEPAIPPLQVNEDQAMALQRLDAIQNVVSDRSKIIDDLALQARNARAEIDRIDNEIVKARSQGLADEAIRRRAAEDARVKSANESLAQKRAEAERVARELTEQDRRIAKEQADAVRALEVERARAAVAKDADKIAAQRTERMQREAQAEAARMTKEQQAQSDAAHAAELARRRSQAEQEFEIGKGSESFTTQLDAAYEQVARNAPSIQKNPLGSQNEPGRTRTAQLMDEFGQEARRAMKLRGYKEGKPFDDKGGIRSDLLEYLDEHLGQEVSSRIRAFSDARANGRFVPSVQGLRDMRTAIGREMEAAKRAKYQGETRTADEAMLARLYDALSQDVQTFLRSAGEEGQLAARQMMQVDSEYKRYLRDLRMPLSKIFGENVPPEQAIATLRKATRYTGGDVRLLERFYTVASARGDRLRATNSILQSMLDDGLPTFLKEYRNISPEARTIMFSGAAEPYGRALDAIAKAGGHLERYVQNAGRTPRLRETISNPGNIMAVLSGFLHVPTAMLGIVGATATSRILASKGFNQWLRKAPAALRTSRDWKRHVQRLNALVKAYSRGGAEGSGKQLMSALLPQDDSTPAMPSVVPRHRTRNDVIERLQYEAN